MGFGQEMRDFNDAFEQGTRIRLNQTNREKVYESYRQPTDAELAEKGGGPFGGAGSGGVGTAEAPQVQSDGGGSGRKPTPSADIAWKDAKPHQRALLNTLAGPESGGAYDIIYGGDAFTDFSRHPGVDVPIKSGPNQGKTSSAAGRYQFIGSTWNDIANKWGLKDFSPENQDKAAWYLAAENYGRVTGRSLDQDLQTGDPHIIAGVGKALRGTWTSLPSGIEQGTTTDKFVSTFNNWMKPGPSQGPTLPPTATSGIPPEEEEEKKDDNLAEAAPAPAEAEPVATENPEITVVEAQQPEITPVLVEDEPMGLYRAGGGIPDDTRNFQDGGTADPYNPSRGYTQAVPQTAAAATPRRISFPDAGSTGTTGTGQDWRSWEAAGGSPAQQSLRARQATLTAERQAAKDAEAKAAADKAALDAANAAKSSTGYEIPGQQRTGPMMGNWMTEAQWAKANGATDDQIKQILGRAFSGGISGGTAGGGRYREGGVVESYARGGAVKRPATGISFEERVARYKRTMGSQEARDRAAREMNRMTRGIDSTAWKDTPSKFPPAPAAPARAKAKPATKKPVTSGPAKRFPDTAPVPTPRPSTESKPSEAKHRRVQPPPVERFGREVPEGGYFEQPKGAGRVQPPPVERFKEVPEGGYFTAPEGSTGRVQPPPVDRFGRTPPPQPEGYYQQENHADEEQFQNYARGGAIPDDNPNERQQSAGYSYPTKRKKKAKADAWEGLRTKTSKKQRPKSTAKPTSRNAKKKAGKKPQSQRVRTPDTAPIPSGRPSRLPDEGPIPQARPGPVTAAPIDIGAPGPAPIPGPSPHEGPSPVEGPSVIGPNRRLNPAGHPPNPRVGRAVNPDLPPQPGGYNRQEEEARIMSDMRRNRLGPGQRPESPGPAPAPAPARPGRVQPTPTPRFGEHPAAGYDVPARGGPQRPFEGAPGSPVVGSGRPVVGSGPISGRGGASGAGNPVIGGGGGQAPPEEVPYDESLEATPWLAYQRGGAIPDEGEGPYSNWRAEEAGYTTSSADPNVARPQTTPSGVVAPEQAPQQRTQAEPPQSQVDIRQARAAAQPAVQIGQRGLERIFGLGGQQQGAIATPEDAARKDAGIRRFASGEGGATKQELAAIDHSFGFDQIKADEGTKNLMRLDATVRWHLERGDKERAEAVAASILLSGATQVRQAGTMAQVAFQKYQQTGDPQDLRNASLAVQKAHQLIPDGLNMKIDVDPKTRQIVATIIDADGKEQQQVVDPMAVPELLKSAMDGSAYWNAMFQVGQPQLAESESRGRRTAQDKAADRAYNEQWEQQKWERNQGATIDTEERAATRKLWERGLDTAEGRTETERKRVADDAFFVDWSERLGAVTDPEEQKKLVAEGLGYRYEGTDDRRDALADEEIKIAVAADKTIEEADKAAILDIARSIGAKNDDMDEAAAAAYASALVTQQAIPTRNGTMAIPSMGVDLVFNPMLLPRLTELRKKYKPAQ